MVPPTLISPASEPVEEPMLERPRAKPKSDTGARIGQIAAGVLAGFWVGGAGAYFLGLVRTNGFVALDLPMAAIYTVVTVVPPALFIVLAWSLARGMAMSRAADELAEVTNRLFTADETAARTAARLGRAVRRELDGLNAGLDGAFNRLRALETVLENQISALDEAGARVDVRGEALATRLTQERERIEGVAVTLADAATRAGETVAGRTAQLKSMIEAAEGSLKAAGQSLEGQAANFRQAASTAADAPHAAAVELDKQAKRIESVADAAMARAEFVLGRQERHRAAMNELMGRLKEDSTAFEAALSAQKTTLEQTITAFAAEAKKFETLSQDTDRGFEHLMSNATQRTAHLAQSFAKETDRLKVTAEHAHETMAALVVTMQDAGVSAQTLIGETTGQAKADAKSLVGEAMGECDRLLRTAAKLTQETKEIHAAMNKAVEEFERHISKLPAIAQEEAQRVRQMVRSETEEILDLSARTLSTIHARTTARPTPRETRPEEPAEPADEGLRGLARKLTTGSKKKPKEGEKWQMSTLLAAAAEDRDAPRKDLRPGAAAALGALQAALNDLAIDLDAVSADAEPHEEEWRRYLSGDRAVFARKLASTIDDDMVHRIADLYRENARFRDSANAYMQEFEALLARAKEGDGGGLLAPTILSADTGKIYLTVAYALGRL
ncbi:hypothetical protein FHS83_001453 [Rhizomicrobium palustre]|uniref:Uncharacterized protein n=1 Tax=Rhizomicrobium palustre TaxID=189966 RepID=A0A846MY40_9PROT|nr:hypothetical protein [Rhizomicrobium palustre]NIK88135.1 hypothetical protein [Rhizomicrobium palustre]